MTQREETQRDILRLKCRIQQYAWGKIGSDSIVAQLSGIPIQESEPYAGTTYLISNERILDGNTSQWSI